MPTAPRASRRQLLAAGGSLLLGGCLGYTGSSDTEDGNLTVDRDPGPSLPAASEEATEVEEPAFGDVIDVSEHGFPGDGTGGDLASFVAEHAGDARFELPAGTYRWERPIHFTGGDGPHDEPVPERFGLVGRDRATLAVHIPASFDRHDRRLFTFGHPDEPVPEVALADLHVDVGDADPDRDAGIMRASIGDRMRTTDVSLSRRCRRNPDGTANGDRHTYKCDVVSRSGVAVHRRIDLTAGDVHVPAADAVGHAIPFASEPYHVGTNYWLDCEVAGFTDNGFYLRDGVGPNVMEGCLARNCGGGNVRVGYGDRVRNCRVVVDGAEAPASGCGVWVQDADETVVDGVEIHAPALANDAVRVTGDVRSGAIRNVSVLQGGTQYAIKATADVAPPEGDGASFTVESVDVEDRGDGSTRVASIYAAQDHTTFRDVRLRNRDHGAANGRANLAVAGRDVSFVDCEFTTDNPYAMLLGSPFRPAVVGVSFEDCTVSNTGSATALARYAGSPDLRQFHLRGCAIEGYDTLVADGSVLDFGSALVTETDGLDPVEAV